MATQPTEKPLCFVIGPIGQTGSAVRKHADFLLHGIIRPILEAAEFGYIVKRADEDADPGMITDRVITDIVNAELVVADLTGLNPNVFYELGIRHAREKPVIHIAAADTVLPFDNAPHRAIPVDVSDWQSGEQARERLAKSARLIREPGYQVSNPITQANASFNMRTSADPIERVIADLRERVVTLEERQAKDGAALRNDLVAALRATYQDMAAAPKQNPLMAYAAPRSAFGDPFAGTGGLYGSPNTLSSEVGAAGLFGNSNALSSEYPGLYSKPQKEG